MGSINCLRLFLYVIAQISINQAYIYKTQFLTTPLDHFSFTNNETFQLRYLVNDTYWGTDGPIFFYTGNEGDIELFAQNTGLMWEIAPKFEAMIVFAEHRYYGKTLPYAESSYSDLKHLGYLTSTQALADYVYLLDYIQGTKKCDRKRCPVITFGGSYGGMLAAWMRLKYPYAVYGAVASSAPVLQFQGLTPCSAFSHVVANVFDLASTKCTKNIKKSWNVIRNITSTSEGKLWLTNEWKTCQPLNTTKDVDDVIDGINDIYGNIAMINYPYDTNFLMPVPANPIKAMCSKLDHPDLDGKPLLTALGKALSIYTNYTGTTKCINFKQNAPSLGQNGWDFQACTEIVMPMCVDERNSMFESSAWNLSDFANDCYKKFGSHLTRDDLAVLEYGSNAADYSNVIFTNGLLDPWSPGGVLKSKTQSVYAIIIPEGAHHLDLRASNPRDPDSVINARGLIKNILHVWLKIYKQN